jgi:hypothetical protein
MQIFRLGSKNLLTDRFRAALLVAFPIRRVIASQLMQISPCEQAGVVPVVKDDFHGILSDRLHGTDTDILLTEHQHLLARAMPFDFRGGRMHPQVLERQLEPATVRKTHFQQPGFAAYLDFRREGFRHISASIGRGL